MQSEATNAAAGHEPAAARRELLERCGIAYGELGLALAFTAGVRGDAAKIAHGWKATKPLRSAVHGRALMGTALARNPIVVLGASKLVGIDVDGAAGRALAGELRLVLPRTVTVRTGDGGHLWYRPSEEHPDDVVKVQLAETVTISTDGYFVAPPGVHASGRVYSFVAGREPWSIPIATIPIATVTRIIRAGRRHERDLRDSLEHADGFKVPVGQRRELVFRLASMCRRWTASEPLIVEMCMSWNVVMCDPPLTLEQIRGQVAGAMKMNGGQELDVIRLHELVAQVTGR